MRYLSLIFLLLFFSACNDDQSIESGEYLLEYNSDKTTIMGEAILRVDKVTAGHLITLSSFSLSIDGCNLSPSSSVTPDSINYTNTNLQNSVTFNVTFLQACDNDTLRLHAKRTEYQTLDKKVIVTDSDVAYTFSIQPSAQNATTPPPVLSENNITITKNAQSKTISVNLFDANNVPLSEGSVSVIFPKESSNGVDVGSFTPTKADIKDGKATFTYTAPDDINKLLDSGYTQSEFKFYLNDESSNTTTLTINYSPVDNEIIQTNYNLLFQSEKSMIAIEQKLPFSITLVDKDAKEVSSDAIETLSISLGDNSIASLMNSTGDINASFTYHNANNITATLLSNTTAGLASIYVYAKFTDANNKMNEIKKTFEVIIQSGPPTAISISYVGTSQDESRAKFIESYAISVTDKYLNPVNTHPNVSVGAIVGYALQDKNNKETRLFNDKYALGTLHGDYFELDQRLELNSTDIDLFNDHLATFGERYSYEASGGWDFEDFNATTLFLKPDQFDANDTSGLGYAIGHNFRQDACIYGREWIGQTKLQNDVTTLDDKGTAIIELMYDYYLVGKDIVLYANIVGVDNELERELRIGEAQKRTLLGDGLEFRFDSDISTESASPVTFQACTWIKGTNKHYRNGHFGLSDIKQDGCRTFSLNYGPNPVTSCGNNEGWSCLNVTISADTNATCSVTLGEPLVGREFNSAPPPNLILPGGDDGGILPNPD